MVLNGIYNHERRYRHLVQNYKSFVAESKIRSGRKTREFVINNPVNKIQNINKTIISFTNRTTRLYKNY